MLAADASLPELSSDAVLPSFEPVTEPRNTVAAPPVLEPDPALFAPDAWSVPNPPSVWNQPAAGATTGSSPLRLNPTGQPERAEDDLWRIVEFDRQQAAVPSASASFEEALQQVDANLERLVGFKLDDIPVLEPSTFDAPVEVIVEQTLEAAPPAGDIPFATGDATQSVDEYDDWPWDEDEVAEGDPSDPTQAAKLRRQRLLRRAMENLGALPRGMQQPQGATAVPPPSAAAPSTTTPTPPSRSGDEAQLADAIEKRFRDIQAKKDHFTILGVGREATKDQVKASFLTLAKIFHPDRLPPALIELAPKMTAVFESVREAYETLHDDIKRKAYVATLNTAQQIATARQQPAKPGLETPDDLFKKGELAFRKRDYLQAEAFYERAHTADPKSAVYLAAKAWALYMDPARKAEAAKAKQQMNEALRIDPNCDRAHYQLGVIARVEGDMDRAEKHFRDAVRSNAKHLEANQELRLIEMRKKTTPPKKGFFR